MDFQTTSIEGLVVCRSRVFPDERGYFFESFSQRQLREAIGREVNFVQDNESRSAYGVIRGLHFQRGEHAQAKLVRCTLGRLLDVAVDLRPGSPTYGKHFAIELSEDNKLQLFIPRGFAHGFSVLSPQAVLQYKCDNYYCPQAEGGINLADPSLGIDWKIPPQQRIISPKDLTRPCLGDCPLSIIN